MHFFLYFTDDITCCSFCIYFIDYRNDVRQKASLSDFPYSSSKWVRKWQKQLAASIMHLAQEPLTNVQCSGGLRSFYKGDESLEDENSGWPSDIHNDQLRASSKLIVLKLHEKLYKN